MANRGRDSNISEHSRNVNQSWHPSEPILLYFWENNENKIGLHRLAGFWALVCLFDIGSYVAQASLRFIL